MKLLKSFLIVLTTFVVAVPSHAQTPAFADKTPQVLCAYMQEMGIPGAATYRDQGKGRWACGSTRKKLIQGEPAAASDLQYRVLGTASSADKQILELRMRSYREPQGVLRVFSGYVDVLLEKTLGVNISEEMYKSIMAPVDGSWRMNGHSLTLRKLHSKGNSYDLRFTVEPATSPES